MKLNSSILLSNEGYIPKGEYRLIADEIINEIINIMILKYYAMYILELDSGINSGNSKGLFEIFFVIRWS